MTARLERCARGEADRMGQKKSLLDRVVLPLRKKKILWRLILLYAVICVLPILLFGMVYQALYTRELKNKSIIVAKSTLCAPGAPPKAKIVPYFCRNVNLPGGWRQV